MAGDIYFQDVALLLLGNAFTDLSYSKAAVHPGPVVLTNAFPGVAASSYWFERTFSGITMYVDHPVKAAIAENQDCAIEIIFYLQPNRAGGALWSNRTESGVFDGLLIGLDTLGKPFVRLSSGGVLQIALDGQNTPTMNGLHTLKVHRAGGLWGMMLDGVPQIDLRHQPVYNGAVPHGNKIFLGCDPYTSNFVGTINAARVTVGAARQLGAYVPDATPWPIYDTDPNILFGSLSTSISTAGAQALFTLDIQNVVGATISAVDGANNHVGSNWAITYNPIQGPYNYKITGNAPTPLADYTLIVTGTTTAELGGLSKSQSFVIHNTVAGALSAEQSLIAALGGARLWLDGSDATTTLISGSNIASVINKVDSMPLTPALARPAPVLDTTSMIANSIGFIGNASSGLVPQVPIVLTDGASNSTIVLVGKYSGTQVGQGAGLFQISYSDDDARQDGTTAWTLSTTSTGVASAIAAMYDSTQRQNGIATAAAITPGETFIVAWNTATNKADIWLQQRHMSDVVIDGTLDFWSSVSAAIGFIGGSQNPTGAFISMGELIALAVDLTQNNNNAKLEQLISFLNHKWSVFTNVPYAQTPSTLSGFIGNPFAATVVIVDATTVNISANAGSNWSISPSGSLSVPNEYLITGILPSTAQNVVLSLAMSNVGASNTDTFTVDAQQLPDKPVIGTPVNLQAQQASGYASLLNVYSADSVSIVGSDGSGWAIEPIAGSDIGNYLITGVAPNSIGSMSLTVTAQKLDTATGLMLQTINVFTLFVVASFVTERDQHQTDLTGLLPANLISNEAQTLTSANGVNEQVLIPVFAPYFGSSLVLQYYDSTGAVVNAVKGVDYVPSMRLGNASDLAQTDIFSAILVLNPSLRGSVFLNYQTLGGGFGVDARTLLPQLAAALAKAYFISWDSITGKPVFFPVSGHYLDIQKDTVGFSSLVSALQNFKNALGVLSEADVVDMLAHMARMDNPHQVTKAQIGLSLVQNYPLATVSEAQDGSSSQRYLTPKTAAIAIAASLPVAQDHVTGKFYLNQGKQPGDDTNTTNVLTAAGLVALLISPSPNAFSSLIESFTSKAEQLAQASPHPATYPLWWKGVYCADETAFVNAVSSYTGFSSLRFSRTLSAFYFPLDYTPPDLTTSPAYSVAASVAATVETPVALPLLLGT